MLDSPPQTSTVHFTDPAAQRKKTLHKLGSTVAGWPFTEGNDLPNAGPGGVSPKVSPPSQPLTLGNLPATSIYPGRRVPPQSSDACRPPLSVRPPFDRDVRTPPPLIDHVFDYLNFLNIFIKQ